MSRRHAASDPIAPECTNAYRRPTAHKKQTTAPASFIVEP